MAGATEALVIAAHGSHRDVDSARPALDHADRIRERDGFDEVRAAFWKEEPAFREVLRTLRSERVFVVPLFMSEGYFVERILPRELRLRAGDALDVQADVTLTPPVGTHSTMRAVIRHRARSILEPSVSPAETALVIVGHGTERHDESATSTRRHVEWFREHGTFGEVTAAFLDEPPHVADVTEHVSARDVVVVPLFVADGYHTKSDIPAELGIGGPDSHPETVDGTRIWYAGAVGTDSRMVDVIVERAREAGAVAERGPPSGDGEDDPIAALLDAATSGVDRDGLSVATDADGAYRIETSDSERHVDDLASARAVLSEYPDAVANWSFWESLRESTTGDEYVFLRWLEDGGEAPLTGHLDRLGEGMRSRWGDTSVLVTGDSTGERTYRLTHFADRDAPHDRLERMDGPAAVRELARTDAAGRFRPLKGAPTLEPGWLFETGEPMELLRAIEWLYPASISNWARERRGELDVSHWTDTASRQTGLYASVSELPRESVQWAATACCTDGACGKRRRWEYAADDEISVAGGDGAIPCREPCSFFIAAAKEWVAIESDGSERDDADAILDDATEEMSGSVPAGAFEAPTNRTRMRYLAARRADLRSNECGE